MTEVEARRNELIDKERLTDKQAAILAAFDENPGATYSDIADVATEILPDDMSVTGSYATEQIKQRRPDWFENGERLRPSEVDAAEPDEDEDEVPDDVQKIAEGSPVSTGKPEPEVEVDDSRVALLADWYGVGEEEARQMARAEQIADVEFSGREGVEEPEPEPAPEPEPEQEELSVGMDEDEWLRIVAYLHLFANTQAGAPHEERLMDLAGKISTQALEE